MPDEYLGRHQSFVLYFFWYLVVPSTFLMYLFKYSCIDTGRTVLTYGIPMLFANFSQFNL